MNQHGTGNGRRIGLDHGAGNRCRCVGTHHGYDGHLHGNIVASIGKKTFYLIIWENKLVKNCNDPVTYGTFCQGLSGTSARSTNSG